MTAGRVGGPQDFSVNPSPLGTYLNFWDLVGARPWVFGDKGFGLRLDDSKSMTPLMPEADAGHRKALHQL